jgi:hypothetical protein
VTGDKLPGHSQKEKVKQASKLEESQEKSPKNLKNKELDAATEELLDEIDEVLEDATLALTYSQRGGE